MNLAPIILFVYNRPEHTKKTIDALKLNQLASDSLIFIFSDGNKNENDRKAVEEVRNYIVTISGFKDVKITLRDKNLGLADSVISGVTEVIEKFGKAIVLEDDIVTSPYFLKFMNEALDFYEKDKRIYSISGYNFPIKIPKSYQHKIYISPRPSSWGWATWKDRWGKVDWIISDYDQFLSNKKEIKKFNLGGDDLTRMLKKQMSGKINSWAIRWTYAHYKGKGYCLFPLKSFAKNIGADRSGIHTRKTNKFNVDVYEKEYRDFLWENPEVDEKVLKNFQKFFSKKNPFKRIRDLIP
ncbi:MAG TPA: glycosyltransferase [Ignavibacteriaceae bacterium]|nr:glycosyltransferase [Ignavibacteriaceae bacterium]